MTLIMRYIDFAQYNTRYEVSRLRHDKSVDFNYSRVNKT